MNTQDTELVLRALQGDKKAFGELVDKHQGVVYGLCFHLVGNFADAQDLAQEAFVQAYLDLHQLREPDKFANWLYRVTMNVCNWQKTKGNVYFALRRSGYAGTDIYLILGDPNAEKFQHRLVGKIVRAF